MFAWAIGCTPAPSVDPAADPIADVLRSVEVEGAAVPRVSRTLSGGGLAAGDPWIGASDLDGDRVVFVAHGALREVELPSGWAPGPVAWDADGRLHVLLYGAGALLVADPGDDTRSVEVVDRVPVCPAPRGLARDEDRDVTWVVCAGGELVRYGRDGVESAWIDPGLQDIVVAPDGRALVSRLREAEVLVVDLDEARVTARYAAPAKRDRIARVARRLVPDGNGALLVYQLHTDEDVFVFPDATPYAGFRDCDAVVLNAVAEVGPDGFGRVRVGEGGPVIDLDPSSGRRPILIEAHHRVDRLSDGDCSTVRRQPDLDPDTLMTAVSSIEGEPLVLTRQPFGVRHPRWSPAFEAEVQQPEEPERPDRPLTPLALFESAPNGVACVSCHPGGADDAHTWRFVTLTARIDRRTQPLGGGIADTAPFHWDATLLDLDALYEDVAMGRMGLQPVSATAIADLAEFLDGLPVAPHAGPPPDPESVARGAELFFSEGVGCAECHSGARFSDGSSYHVGTGELLQVPTLLGVAGRLPLMHDGCATTLEDRFDPACGGGAHGDTIGLGEGDTADLIAFLRTL